MTSNELVYSFNVPIYIPTACEVKQVVSINKHLTTDRMEEVKYLHKIGTAEEIKVCSLHIRATVEGILSDPKHFGSQLVAKRQCHFASTTQKNHLYLRTNIQ